MPLASHARVRSGSVRACLLRRGENYLVGCAGAHDLFDGHTGEIERKKVNVEAGAGYILGYLNWCPSNGVGLSGRGLAGRSSSVPGGGPWGRSMRTVRRVISNTIRSSNRILFPWRWHGLGLRKPSGKLRRSNPICCMKSSSASHQHALTE